MESRHTSMEERLIYLFQRHISRTLSAEEAAELQDWAQSSAGNQQLLADMANPAYREAAIRNQQSFDAAEALQRVKPQLKAAASKRTYFYRYAVAAASLVLISFAGYYFYKGQPSIHPTPRMANAGNITPGSNKAVLTLADGSKIALSDAANGKLAEQAGIRITKTADGQLVYEIVKPGAGSNAPAYNMVETPKGGQHQIVLQDGSKIWLNAASSLTFPSTFEGAASRMVALHGEAYFEITKDTRHPFIVKTTLQEVKVLGTHFNINSYPEESTTRTTLLEGAVSVTATNIAGNAPLLLKPGQQAVVNGANIHVVPVDTEEETAWKNGRFSFNGEDFSSVMRMIARWYDVDITYEYDPGVLHIGGEVSRNRSLADVLKMLEVTGDVKFKINGRMITVTK